MMNKILKYTATAAIIVAAALFAGCDDWTEVRSLDIKEYDAAKDNPELYQRYLANLREYKSSDHQLMCVGFDNIAATPVSQGQHLTALPDSVDVVCLMNPDGLADWVQAEIRALRADKAMKFIFNISYVAMQKDYDIYVIAQEALQKAADEAAAEGETPEQIEVIDFVTYAGNYVDQHLALVDKYGYDGISVLYYGAKTTHMTDAQKEEHLAREEVFMSKFHAWVDANPGKTFIFEGLPQNLTDKSILHDALCIVIRTESHLYATRLGYDVALAMESGVPADRYVVAVNAKSLDPTDKKTGNYFNTDNELVSCIPLAAEWVITNDAEFTKKGLYVLNVQNEYYDAGKSYKNVLTAIDTMNPAPKI